MPKPIVVENGSRPIKLVRLSRESTGNCPCCDERPGYAYEIPGVGNGYVEACKVCAPDEVEHAAEFAAEEMASL